MIVPIVRADVCFACGRSGCNLGPGPSPPADAQARAPLADPDVPDGAEKENEDDDEPSDWNGLLQDAAWVGAGSVVAGFVAPAAGTAALSAAGFTSAGIAAGSFAAGIQGPAVAAGSWFATFQSIGATGGFVFGGPVAWGAGAAVAIVGGGVTLWYRRGRH